MKSVLAICFAEARETYHHWKVYADGVSGVCVEFSKDLLLEAFKKRDGMTIKPVEYKQIYEVQSNTPPIEEWPFLKRSAFQDEIELRAIYCSDTEELDVKDVEFDLKCIRRITLSPWLHVSMVKAVVDVIKNIDGCSGLFVAPSSLLENKLWRDAINDDPRLR